MYNLSLSGIELALLKHTLTYMKKLSGDDRFSDLLKVIESQTTPKAMGGET